LTTCTAHGIWRGAPPLFAQKTEPSRMFRKRRLVRRDDDAVHSRFSSAQRGSPAVPPARQGNGGCGTFGQGSSATASSRGLAPVSRATLKNVGKEENNSPRHRSALFNHVKQRQLWASFVDASACAASKGGLVISGVFKKPKRGEISGIFLVHCLHSPI